MVNNGKDQAVLKKLFFLLAVAVCFGLLGFWLGRGRKSTSEELSLEEFASPTAETKMDSSFDFPIDEVAEEDKDELGFGFRIANARKVGLIATRGEPVKAAPGEEFLVLSLEIENSHPYLLKIDSQGYLRLQGEEGKKYAPDFYNGPIEVAAESVKKDEVGFTVSQEQKDFKLLVGPVTGQKEEVEISF